MTIAPRIDPAAARQKIETGEAVPLDVTSSLVYPAVTRRIPNSIRIAPEPIIRALNAARPMADVAQLFSGLPPGREIIAYCT